MGVGVILEGYTLDAGDEKRGYKGSRGSGEGG